MKVELALAQTSCDMAPQGSNETILLPNQPSVGGRTKGGYVGSAFLRFSAQRGSTYMGIGKIRSPVRSQLSHCNRESSVDRI